MVTIFACSLLSLSGRNISIQRWAKCRSWGCWFLSVITRKNHCKNHLQVFASQNGLNHAALEKSVSSSSPTSMPPPPCHFIFFPPPPMRWPFAINWKMYCTKHVSQFQPYDHADCIWRCLGYDLEGMGCTSNCELRRVWNRETCWASSRCGHEWYVLPFPVASNVVRPKNWATVRRCLLKAGGSHQKARIDGSVLERNLFSVNRTSYGVAPRYNSRD